ncbi:hypothetical protein OTSGILL_2955 [Orientia tsutsugamushi str. Gilliam]|uniref:Uncharacterized protein n=1 Tax=Orientia tsutsugamushi str. Gilliam TaxID=1359184 RepID=A0A0F3M4C3_ORITS|nr:hypothetical protein OTSGILL_2955 [Orientia tsutsugamushi str. Gilliam]
MSKYVSLDKFIVVPTPSSIPVPQLQHLKIDISPPVTKLMLCYLQLCRIKKRRRNKIGIKFGDRITSKRSYMTMENMKCSEEKVYKVQSFVITFLIL